MILDSELLSNNIKKNDTLLKHGSIEKLDILKQGDYDYFSHGYSLSNNKLISSSGNTIDKLGFIFSLDFDTDTYTLHKHGSIENLNEIFSHFSQLNELIDSKHYLIEMPLEDYKWIHAFSQHSLSNWIPAYLWFLENRQSV